MIPKKSWFSQPSLAPRIFFFSLKKKGKKILFSLSTKKSQLCHLHLGSRNFFLLGMNGFYFGWIWQGYIVSLKRVASRKKKKELRIPTQKSLISSFIAPFFRKIAFRHLYKYFSSRRMCNIKMPQMNFCGWRFLVLSRSLVKKKFFQPKILSESKIWGIFETRFRKCFSMIDQ